MASDQHPPTTTTIPSDPATVSPTPKSATPPPSRNGSLLRKLRTYLLRYIVLLARRTDRNLLRLSKLLSDPASTDALLGTTGYTLELICAICSRLVERQIASITSSIVSKADKVLLPGESLKVILPTPRSTDLLAQTATSTKAIAAVISDFRIFVRLWGLVGVYTWARGTWHAPLSSDATRKDRVVRGVVWAEIASIVAFQVLENGAYLASKGALEGLSGWTSEAGTTRETKWWMWSSRFWAAYVALELVRVSVAQYYHTRPSATPTSLEEKLKLHDGEKEAKLLLEERKRENFVWWRDLISNIAYMPMTLHWSVEEGVLSDWGVGILGSVAGGTLLVDSWRGTA